MNEQTIKVFQKRLLSELNGNIIPFWLDHSVDSKNGGFGGRMSNEELIQILSTKYIGPKSSIMVVEVAGNVMILGLSNNQISYLKSIDNEESLERLRPLRDDRTRSGSFSDQLALCKTRLLSMCSFTQEGGKS